MAGHFYNSIRIKRS